MTPNRVNRAHWPTKENRQNFCIFSILPAHAKNALKWHQMGPGGFFPTNPDLADILGRTDLNFESSYFLIFWAQKFWISRSPDPRFLARGGEEGTGAAASPTESLGSPPGKPQGVWGRQSPSTNKLMNQEPRFCRICSFSY